MKINFNEIHNIKDKPLVIDDLTYESFKSNKIVYPITYLMFGESLQKGVIDSLDRNKDLRGITACSYLSGFNQMHSIKIIEKKTLNTQNKGFYEICYWEAKND
jgi:hypothetical protein